MKAISLTAFVSWATLVGLLVALPTGASVTPTERVSDSRLGQGENPNKDEAPSSAITPFLGGLTIFADRPSFDAAFPGLPTEDFEAGAVADGGVVACAAPLSASGDGVCFAPGAIQDGLIFQDSPGPDKSAGLLLIGDGTFGNLTKILSSNSLADSTEILFPDPLEAVGLDLINLPGPDDAVTIDVFAPGGELLGSVSSPSSATGVFWGVSSPDPIGRLVLTSTINQVEGIDNLSFGVGDFLSLDDVVSVDTCAPEPANDNGVWEPNEEIELVVTLRASGSSFSGISGALSSADPAIALIDGVASWPDLGAGESAANTSALRLVVNGDLCADLVSLTLDVTANEGSFQLALSELVGADQAPDIPVAIPDGTLLGAASTLEIATDVVLSGLEVEVEIEHTWVGDLTLSLESPGGTTIVLLDRPGVPVELEGCNNNNVDVTFTDGAVDPENFCNPSSSDLWISGDVAPAEALSTFDGESSLGTWTLRAQDSLAGDLGTIVGWRLVHPEPLGAECTPCNAQSDLALNKECVGFPSFECSLEVSNLGASAAFDIVVTDTIPAPLFWIGDDCGAGPPIGDMLVWAAPPLASGESAICSVQFGAPDTGSGEVLNVAVVSSGVPDPETANNAASAPLTLGTTLDIPTLDVLGLAVLAMGLGALALLRLRRREESPR